MRTRSSASVVAVPLSLVAGALAIAAPFLMNSIFELSIAPKLLVAFTVGSAVGMIVSLSLIWRLRTKLASDWGGFATAVFGSFILYSAIVLAAPALFGEFDASVFVVVLFPPFGFAWLSFLCLLTIAFAARHSLSTAPAQAN